MYKSRHNKASSKTAQRRKIRRVLRTILGIFVITGFFTGSFFLLRADFLQIRNFEVLGTETILPEDIKNTAGSFASGTKFFVIPKSNIFILNKEKLASVLLSNFSRIEKVGINKQFFGRNIELSVLERKEDFLWCSAQMGCFAMAQNGFIFEKSENTGSKLIFRGVLEENPLMKSFAAPERMQNYLALINVFKNADFDVISIDIESPDKAVAKIGENNITSDIIFDPEEKNLSAVAENSVLLINNVRNKTPSAHFQYIDTRFGNKFFYKLI